MVAISIAFRSMYEYNYGIINTVLGWLGVDSSFNVPADGFYRDNRYVEGKTWYKPGLNEMMIFNDKIAMSWDEIEDLARLMTKSSKLNTKSPTAYVFYTEWWNAYAWSIGGDCLVDLGEDGYALGLQEDYANYIVTDGTYTGAYTKKVYAKGEILDFVDKINVKEGESINAMDDGTFTINGKKATIREEVMNASNLSELPSMKNALQDLQNLRLRNIKVHKYLLILIHILHLTLFLILHLENLP